MTKEFRIYKQVGYNQNAESFTKVFEKLEEKINSDSEIINRAKKCNCDFRKKLNDLLEKVEPEFTGHAVINLLRNTPKIQSYGTIDHEGKTYKIEIDFIERNFVLSEI